MIRSCTLPTAASLSQRAFSKNKKYLRSIEWISLVCPIFTIEFLLFTAKIKILIILIQGLFGFVMLTVKSKST